MIKTTTEDWTAFIFKRADGQYMIQKDSGSMEGARWSEWTTDPFEATRYCDERGFSYDHRWEDMLQDAKAVKVVGKTTHVVDIPW